MVEVDARGLSCPEPMMMAADAIKQNAGEQIRVLVSSTIARDNVCSVAKKRKRTATSERVGDDYIVTID